MTSFWQDVFSIKSLLVFVMILAAAFGEELLAQVNRPLAGCVLVLLWLTGVVVAIAKWEPRSND